MSEAVKAVTNVAPIPSAEMARVHQGPQQIFKLLGATLEKAGYIASSRLRNGVGQFA